MSTTSMTGKGNKQIALRVEPPLEQGIKIALEQDGDASVSAWIKRIIRKELQSRDIATCEKKLTPAKPPESVSTIVPLESMKNSAPRGVFTNRKKLFAEALKKGMTQKAAAIAAGYSEKTAKVKGSQLAKDPHVVAYMASESE